MSSLSDEIFSSEEIIGMPFKQEILLWFLLPLPSTKICSTKKNGSNHGDNDEFFMESRFRKVIECVIIWFDLY